VVLASVNPFPPFSESQDNGTLLKDWKKKVNDIAWDLFDDKFFSIIEADYNTYLHPVIDQFGVDPDLIPGHLVSFQTSIQLYLAQLKLSLTAWVVERKERFAEDSFELAAMDDFSNKLDHIFQGLATDILGNHLNYHHALPLLCPSFYKDLLGLLKSCNESVIKASLAYSPWLSTSF